MIVALSSLLLIPICSYANHAGGQSTIIPNPRFICRVFGMSLAFGVFSQSVLCFLFALAGMALWALPGWAEGFVIFDGKDTRNNSLIDRLTNKIRPVCDKTWGLIFFTLRGLYIYPLFIALSYLLTPWALLIGFGGALMGVCYRYSPSVLVSEYKMGAVIGLMFSLVLFIALK